MTIAAVFARVSGIAFMWALLSAAATQADEVGPKFKLQDQNGHTVTERTLAGKPSVIHFGFTHCPVICPTTLYETAEYMKVLGEQSAHINFVFVSVDPERDTPDVLNAYIGSFDERIIGLTGDEGQIAALARSLGASYARQKLPDGTYTMEHTVYAFLMDRHWRKVGTIFMGSESNSKRVVERLRGLLDTR